MSAEVTRSVSSGDIAAGYSETESRSDGYRCGRDRRRGRWRGRYLADQYPRRNEPSTSAIAGRLWPIRPVDLSGPAIRPIAVRMVYQVAAAVRMPVIGIGGIMASPTRWRLFWRGRRPSRLAPASSLIPGLPIRLIDELDRGSNSRDLRRLSQTVGIANPGYRPGEDQVLTGKRRKRAHEVYAADARARFPVAIYLGIQPISAGRQRVSGLGTLALIPLAGLLGRATEEVAIYTGPKIGPCSMRPLVTRLN